MATPTNPEDVNQDTQPGPAGTTTITTPGENTQVIPQSADFGSLIAPFVDFNAAFDFAQGLAEENRQAFLDNLNSIQSRQTALNILGTDIEGILQGANRLAPFVREQGDIDTQKNIERAGEIDQFNFSRLGAFNRFNIEEQKRAQQARDEAVQGSGLDFRGRITRLLDDLERGTQGRLPKGLEQDFLRDARNRGSEIGAATGISPLSQAGVRASDRLLVGERIGISQRAQQLLPNVLGGAQNVLQSPTAPTLFAQPTGVPLNPSNIADRLPVQSNLSAGALQQSIGTAATQIGTIPTTTALSGRLQTEQFNEQSRFSTDLTKLNAEQAHLNAVDNAVQGGFNADKGDEIRAQQFDAFNRGLEARAQSERLDAGSRIISSLLGASASTPEGGTSIGGKILDTVVGGVGGIIDAGAGIIDKVFGNGDGKLTVGKTEISGDSFGRFVDQIGDFFGGSKQPAQAPSGPAPEGTPAQRAGLVPTSKPSSDAGTAGAFQKIAQPTGLDTQTVIKAGLTAAAFPQLNSSQKLQAVGGLTTDILANRGVIDSGRAQQLNQGISALSVITNPNATGADRTRALTTLAAQHFEIPFEGDVRAPTSIRGREVIRDTVDPRTGERSFTTLDEKGNEVVTTERELANASTVVNGLQAINVLTSDASTANKVLAVTSLGVDAATANNIVSEVAGGNILAGLGLINTAINFDNMSPVQQAVMLTKVGLTTTEGFINVANAANAGNFTNAGLSFLTPGGTSAGTAGAAGEAFGAATSQFIGKALPIVGGAAAIAQGIDTALDTVDAVKGLSKKEARKVGAKGFQQAVTGLPGVPGVSDEASVGIQAAILPAALVGGAIGVAVGEFTGSGKSKAQMARDSWKNAVVKSGFGEKVDGQVHVTLADGEQHKLFSDQKDLVNADGTTRRNVDIDWDNEVQTNSIPDAHLFAIASGLDPTSQRQLFHEAVGASVNTATQGVDSIEGAQANFKAMFKDKVDPRQLAMRVETLRTTNKITDQEYNVYLDKINNMFGSQLQPTDRDKARKFLVEQLQGAEKLSGPEKKLLRELTDPKVIAKAEKQLQQRLDRDASNKADKTTTTRSPLPTAGQDLRANVANLIDTTVQAPKDNLISPITLKEEDTNEFTALPFLDALIPSKRRLA